MKYQPYDMCIHVLKKRKREMHIQKCVHNIHSTEKMVRNENGQHKVLLWMLIYRILWDGFKLSGIATGGTDCQSNYFTRRLSTQTFIFSATCRAY